MLLLRVKTIAYLVLPLLCFMGVNPAKASHLMGSDITYKCINKYKYQVTLTVYRDCKGQTLSTAGQRLDVICNNTGAKRSYGLTYISRRDITNIGQHCTNISSLCSGGSFPYGIQEYTFRATIDLTLDSAGCTSFDFSWNQNARNSAITTGAKDAQFYTEATVFVNQSDCNSSPVFSTPATALVCVGTDFVFNNGALDTIDYDILTYQLVSPLAAANSSLGYLYPYSATKPLMFLNFPDATAPLPGGFHLDSLTGNLAFRPTQVNQVTVLVLEVTEWRKVGNTLKKVGITRRDMQLSVISCNSNKSPVITGDPIEVCAGAPLCFAITATDPDVGNTVNLSWNAGISGGNFTTNAAGNYDSGYFCWNTKPSDARLAQYTFTVTATDNGCPLAGQSVKAFSVKVHGWPQVDFTVNDSQQCTADQDFNFTNTTTLVSGPFTSRWFFSDGQYSDSIHPKNLKFNTLGEYRVKLLVEHAGNCNDSIEKPVWLFNTPDPGFPFPPTFCNVNTGYDLLPATPGGTFTGKHVWFDKFYPQVTGPDTVAYTITVDGCPADTFFATSVLPMPTAAFTVNDTDQCIESHSFEFLNSTPSGISYWYLSDGREIQSTHLPGITFAEPGAYSAKLVLVETGGCSDTTEAMLVVYPRPDPDFVVPSQFYCAGKPAAQMIPVTPGGVFSGKSISNGEYIPSNNGMDTIRYIVTVNGCTADTLKTTQVYPTPKLNLGPDGIRCIADPITLHIESPNSSYVWHDGSTSPFYTINGPGKYWVTVYNICDTLTDTLNIRDCFYNIMPNVFTPNGDNLNDIFLPYIENAEGIYLAIFDRWGEKLFETQTLGAGWDGTYKGAHVPDGIYMWVMEIKYTNSDKGGFKSAIERGNVTLMR